MAVNARSSLLFAGAALLVGCSDLSAATTDGPLSVEVTLDGSNSKQVAGEAWSATVCADDSCKTFSPASCAADTGNNCLPGPMTIIFHYPRIKDRPSTLSVRIVSDAGKILYTNSKSNDCRLVQNICKAKFLLP